MTQINNGFMYYYYLTEEGQVYNAKTGKFLKPYCGCYKMRTVSGENKSMSRGNLTALIFGYTVIQDNIERLDGEVFQPIPGTDGIYAISNYGRAISYTGQRVHLLRQGKNTKNGYYRINIKIDGKYHSKLVHSLVADAFCSLPEGYTINQVQVHHKDFNKENNAAWNLEYLTPAEHMRKHIEHTQEGGQADV